MKTIKLNGEYTEEQLLKLIEESKKPKHWSEEWLQVGDIGYYPTSPLYKDFEDLRKVFSGGIRSHENTLTHFKEKGHAELMWEKTVLMYEMHNFACLRNDGWVADCGNANQNKCGLVLFENKIETNYSFRYNYFIFGVAVKSYEIAEEMLEVFGDRLREFYNKQF